MQTPNSCHKELFHTSYAATVTSSQQTVFWLTLESIYEFTLSMRVTWRLSHCFWRNFSYWHRTTIQRNKYWWREENKKSFYGKAGHHLVFTVPGTHSLSLLEMHMAFPNITKCFLKGPSENVLETNMSTVSCCWMPCVCLFNVCVHTHGQGNALFHLRQQKLFALCFTLWRVMCTLWRISIRRNGQQYGHCF